MDRLIAAHDDAQGVTAAFDKNLLARKNRELEGDFDLDAFRPEARWNAEQDRIEMHLVSLVPQTVTVAGARFELARGETKHTENSDKFTVEGFRTLARDAGWAPHKVWTDAASLLSVHVLTPLP